ncbi:MAG: efflux RND transporter periplasmic adaptor subunit [Thermodesulfobacteriota bacterium]
MKKTFTTASILFACAIAFAGCGREEPARHDVRRVIKGAKAAPVGESEAGRYLEFSGTVRARSTSVVAGKVMGTVESVKVREGDHVEKGQLLLTIEARETAERVRAAEAARNQVLRSLMTASQNRLLALRTYQRYKKLYDQKAVSLHELETIEAQKKNADHEYERLEEAVKEARARVEEARIYRAYTHIKSPVAGVVSAKRVDAGSMASPGMPLLVIEDTSSFTLDVNVDERMGGSIRPGDRVAVFVGGREREGKVAQVVGAVDPASRTFLVKVDLAGEGLRPGLSGRVRLPAQKRRAIMVPAGALVQKGSLTGVWAVDDEGVVTYRLVRKGGVYGGRVEILSGIEPGERIIVEGADAAFDGGVLR